MTYQADLLALGAARLYSLGQSSGTIATDFGGSASAGVFAPNSAGAWNGGTLGAAGLNTSYPAAEFNGTSGHVLFTGDVPVNGIGKWSFVASLFPTQGGGFRTIFSRYVSNSDRLEISLGSVADGFGANLGLVVALDAGACRTLNDCLTLNAWNHIVVSFDGSLALADRMQIRVNGVQQAVNNDQLPTVATFGTTSCYLGARQAASAFWKGRMQDVALYSGIFLTAADAVNLNTSASNNTPGPPPPPPPSSATLVSASVPVHGASVDLTFSGPITPTAASLQVRVNGVLFPVSVVSGSGALWNFVLGKKYIVAGDSVSVTYGGLTVTATNGSATTPAQVKYLGRQFGMFIHLGVETFDDTLGSSPEWTDPALVSHTIFAPTGNIAAAVQSWVDYALAAGMKYLVLTSKHHYGLCLWPTTTGLSIKDTPWWATAGSPDIVQLFVTKARAAGLGIGLYFSVLDRTWQIRNPGFTGAMYQAHTDAQLAELLTNYGAIDLIWFDGYAWATGSPVTPPNYSTFSYAQLKNMVTSRQPNCAVVVNNHEGTRNNSDILEVELAVTGNMPVGNMFPAEACLTVYPNGWWFHHAANTNVLTTAQVNAYRTTVNNGRGTLLLNCPPDRSGFLSTNAQLLLTDLGSGLYETPGEVRDGTIPSGTPSSNGPGYGGNFLGV